MASGTLQPRKQRVSLLDAAKEAVQGVLRPESAGAPGQPHPHSAQVPASVQRPTDALSPVPEDRLAMALEGSPRPAVNAAECQYQHPNLQYMQCMSVWVNTTPEAVPGTGEERSRGAAEAHGVL